MAHVTLTDYEIEHDLLPGVCVKCGAPTSAHFVHAMRIIDGWRGALLVYVLLFGLFFFPPLALFVLFRQAQVIPIRLPMCTNHRDDLERRRQIAVRILLPIWSAAVIVLDVAIIIALMAGAPAIWCVVYFFPLMVVGILDGLLTGRGAIKLSRPRKCPIRLHDSHPAFVAALLEERARDRVSNPDRRGGHGDVRDDFDDEAV